MTMFKDASSTRTFTPARIVALVLIALLVTGLAYLKVSSGDDSVSVPAGAQAGDLTLEPCSFSTDAGNYDADCGTLVVPENRDDPDSRLIALPVTRIHATSDREKEPIFRLQGGPGLTNMTFPMAHLYVQNRDLVFVGYRGIDGSERLDCPEVESVLEYSTAMLGEKIFNAFADGLRSCAQRLADEGIDVAHYGLVQQVDDMEAAREAFGYERIDLLSESAGTRTALIYSWRYPESIHRSVMVAANPSGNFVWNTKATNEQIERYADLCSKDASCSARTDDLAATMRQTAADMPDRWFFLPIQEDSVRVFTFLGFMESDPELPLNAPSAFDAWLSAADGDASGFWFQSFFAELFPLPFVWGQYATAASIDADAGREYFSPGVQDHDSIGYAASAFAWGGGSLVEAWPTAAEVDEYDTMRTSTTETLVISGELDGSTPPQIATDELLPHLPNGEQVVLEGIAHTETFWPGQPEAQSRLINTYFDTGQVDDSLYKPGPVDFTPAATYPALGKGISGAMFGFALIMVLSLLWMRRRVRNRGHIGPTASATLRSVYPLVLGLGGWFLAVLIAMTTMPSVYLGDELLTTFSIGTPVGLGIYFAWVNRDWSAATKAVGFAMAVAGAIGGAWLGFHATTDLLALITTIAGAAAAANLTLILLDMSRARSVRNQFATTTTVDTPRPGVEPAMPAGVGGP
jgi:pimeloyl-ACP methyl ester carboxylesterase